MDTKKRVVMSNEINFILGVKVIYLFNKILGLFNIKTWFELLLFANHVNYKFCKSGREKTHQQFYRQFKFIYIRYNKIYIFIMLFWKYKLSSLSFTINNNYPVSFICFGKNYFLPRLWLHMDLSKCIMDFI